MFTPIRIDLVSPNLGNGTLRVAVTPLAAYSEAAIIAAGWHLLGEYPRLRRVQIDVAPTSRRRRSRRF